MSGLQKVEYKTVPGYPNYMVGDDGSVWKRTCKNQKHIQGGNSYLMIGLINESINKTISVHRLVLEVFLGPCPDGMQACHNNDVRSDNRLANLRWDTPKNNCADGEKNGRRKTPIGRFPQKLSWDDVCEIRSLHALWDIPISKIAKQFGVSDRLVRAIISNKARKVNKAVRRRDPVTGKFS